jgi:hypothetical protein
MSGSARTSIAVLTLWTEAVGTVKESRAVSFNGNQRGINSQKVLGIAMDSGVHKDRVNVTVIGTAVAETGSAVAIGDSLVVDDRGRVIPEKSSVVPVGCDHKQVFGDALQGAEKKGEFIEVLLRR